MKTLVATSGPLPPLLPPPLAVPPELAPAAAMLPPTPAVAPPLDAPDEPAPPELAPARPAADPATPEPALELDPPKLVLPAVTATPATPLLGAVPATPPLPNSPGSSGATPEQARPTRPSHHIRERSKIRTLLATGAQPLNPFRPSPTASAPQLAHLNIFKNAAPYFSSLAGPTPDTCKSSASFFGLRAAISSKVASLKIR